MHPLEAGVGAALGLESLGRPAGRGEPDQGVFSTGALLNYYRWS
jgi:hypothetical protein